MADILYKAMQKPIEERLIDAACIYWDRPREYFYSTNLPKNEAVYRFILYYIIYHNTSISHSGIATMFGLKSKSRICDAIDQIEAQKNVTKQISEAINQIQYIASKLDADFLTVSIKLENSKQTIVPS